LQVPPRVAAQRPRAQSQGQHALGPAIVIVPRENVLRAPFPGCVPSGHGFDHSIVASRFKAQQPQLRGLTPPSMNCETLFSAVRRIFNRGIVPKISASRKRPSRQKKLEQQPEILVFDVDGVLVDVRQTYWRSALETVRHLTGKRVTFRELHKWKSQPGNNDDWAMTAAWATALGRPTSYEDAREVFTRFYWGADGQKGNVRNEKLLITPSQIARWARRYELNLFTGRTRQEYAATFDNWPAAKAFCRVVTMDDVENGKPHPEGLQQILGRRDPQTALYLGDNIDDALAARDAGVPFMAIIGPGEHGYRERSARFRELGALALLPRATDLSRWLTPP
jgi:HAD superfamily phosphatase